MILSAGELGNLWGRKVNILLLLLQKRVQLKMMAFMQVVHHS